MDATSSVLFGKTRRAVFSLLFSQPERWFYLREMERLTGVSAGALRNELEQLEQAGLLERQPDGNRVTYRANSGHPVFEDLRSIVDKTCGLPGLVGRALEPHEDEIVMAVLYGSMAKGRDHARSDVDLLIVGSIGLDRATDALAPVETQIGREIGLRVFSRKEFESRLSSGDAFLQRVMNGPLTPIIGEPPSA